MGFAQIESSINRYGLKAASGSLALEDMAGGTFTISNGGVFGSMMSTPIVNQPQSVRPHTASARPASSHASDPNLWNLANRRLAPKRRACPSRKNARCVGEKGALWRRGREGE
eukprot:409359-Rhodomonas_salina.1